MDVKDINDLILRKVEVEVWREYSPQFGRESRVAVELMGSGRIVRQSEGIIVLDDGFSYPLANAEVRIKQK